MKRKEIVISPADRVEVLQVIGEPGTDFDLSGCLNVCFTAYDTDEDYEELSVTFSKDGAKEMIELLQEFIEEENK